MDRVFLDANVLFSAAWRANAGLLRLWSLADVQLLSSAYAIEEASRNLPQAEQRERLKLLTDRVDLVPAPAENAALPADVNLPEKDAPILLAAIGAGATHLLTGDLRHFSALFGNSCGGVTVFLPAVYLAGKSPPVAQ